MKALAWIATVLIGLALSAATLYTVISAFYALTFLSGIAFGMFLFGAATSMSLFFVLHRMILPKTRASAGDGVE